MTQLLLMTMVALLAVNVIAQDHIDSDESGFFKLVRRKACAGRSCDDDNASQTQTYLSEEDRKTLDDSSREVGDDNLDEQDTSSMNTRKRTSNKPEYLNKQPNKDDHAADEPKKRCVAWKCKRRLSITRENVLTKKNQVTNNKRCMSWGCRKRSLKDFKRDSTTTRNIDELKERNLKRQERNNQKKKASSKCMAWNCKDGKRTAIMKRSGEIDTNKRIISRKPDDILDLFDSPRDGKCRGLDCLTKRKREQRNRDTYKRIISRKPDDILGLFDSPRDGKCRGLDCLTKRMREYRNSDVASLSRKNEKPSGCMTWNCYGKRTAAKMEPVAIDTFKRITSRKNDMDLNSLGLSNEKCKGWDCIKKRVVHGVQKDSPTKCLSWDCDKRRADTGESTKTQEDMDEQFHEKDESQYGIPDEYKDMIQRPIRRDALGRILTYFKVRGSRRTLQKEDIGEK